MDTHDLSEIIISKNLGSPNYQKILKDSSKVNNFANFKTALEIDDNFNKENVDISPKEHIREIITIGRLKIEGYFENGEKKGLWRTFDNTGNIQGEESYSTDKFGESK